tara:strand:- start:650 stop:790 length:141 start_codon:yes stop_codon:yes gene_type:complete
MNIYFIWILGVIAWNFGYPNATPLMDVLAAVFLSIISFLLKKYTKL